MGSTGAMGRYLVPYLADMGYCVTAVSLDDEKPYNENVTCVKGNAKDFDFLNGLLAQRFDGVVDFMIYGNRDFRKYYKMFLDNTEHYIFLSSCRIYANEEIPVRETSTRLLDVSEDEKLLFNEKAKREIFNVCSSEHRTWEEIAGYYREISGLEAIWVEEQFGDGTDYVDKDDKAVLLAPAARLDVGKIFRDTRENADGIDLRRGCYDIIIENIE